MLSRQPFLRAAHRASQQSRIFVLRQDLRRRFASEAEPPLTGSADNAFNRERRAVKAHAARTAGMISSRCDNCVQNSPLFRYVAETVDIVNCPHPLRAAGLLDLP